MRKITTNSPEEFHRTMAELKASGWRVLALNVGRPNGVWIIEVDDEPRQQQGELIPIDESHFSGTNAERTMSVSDYLQRCSEHGIERGCLASGFPHDGVPRTAKPPQGADWPAEDGTYRSMDKACPRATSNDCGPLRQPLTADRLTASDSPNDQQSHAKEDNNA